jgi:hypothetical protein
MIAALSASAQPAKTKAPLGTWIREAGGAKITFLFEPKTVTVSLHDGDKKLSIEADYAIAQDGTIFGRVAKVKGGNNTPEPGLLFSFKVKRSNGTLTISDLVGPDSNEARNLVEGDYTFQAKKEKDKE